MTDNSPATDELIAQIEADIKHGTMGEHHVVLSLIARIRAETAKNSGEALTVAVRKLGLEELVHGWHASSAYDKHPDELGVTLPTNCGTVYAIAAALSDLPDATPANSRSEAIGVDVRNYGARGSIFDADPIRKAAWKVVLETDRIHDNEPWPIKYRAPYEAIAELRALLQQEGLGGGNEAGIREAYYEGWNDVLSTDYYRSIEDGWLKSDAHHNLTEPYVSETREDILNKCIAVCGGDF